MTTGVRDQARDTSRPRVPRWPSWPVLTAVLVGLAGVGWRVALLLADTPRTNSDEATMGLAALHIAQGENFPVFFYGQAYMGTLEAYLAAPLVALSGPSVLALRLPLVALYALFLVLSWRLAHRLAGDARFALLVVAVLALGSDRVVKNQLIAGGGYPELNPVGVGLALLTLDLVGGRRAGRWWRFAAFGFLAGLVVWVDPLLLPYLLALGAVLVGTAGRELRGRAGALLAGAALLGAAPLLAHSVRHGRNPVSAVFAASGGDTPADWADRLHGGMVLGPPLGMGLCSPSHCATWQLWWAVALPVLLLLAGLSAWRALRSGDPDSRRRDLTGATAATWRGDDRTDTAPERGRSPQEWRAGGGVRLALVVGAVGTLAAYTVSSAAGLTPVESSRYLSCLAVSLPALLLPLWTVATRRAGLPAVARVAALGTLAAVLGTAAVATVAATGTVPANRAEAERHRALLAALRERGVRHVLGEYWTCNRLTFAAREEIVCAVVDGELRPGFDRLPGYRRAVRRADAPAYVALVGSPLAATLERQPPTGYAEVTVDGWRIWLPRR